MCLIHPHCFLYHPQARHHCFRYYRPIHFVHHRFQHLHRLFHCPRHGLYHHCLQTHHHLDHLFHSHFRHFHFRLFRFRLFRFRHSRLHLFRFHHHSHDPHHCHCLHHDHCLDHRLCSRCHGRCYLTRHYRLFRSSHLILRHYRRGGFLCLQQGHRSRCLLEAFVCQIPHHMYVYLILLFIMYFHLSVYNITLLYIF